MLEFKVPSPISKLDSTFFQELGIEVHLKRDDLIHPEISGNKWRKLKYNLEEAKNLGLSTIITFGGAFSNHIAATAVACQNFGFNSIGIIRGEEGFENHTLQAANRHGMKLIFVSRLAYKQKNNKEFLDNLIEKFGPAFIIPEGGENTNGVKGCAEILNEVDENYEFVACSAGTGTTAAGISMAITNQALLVFPALKGGEFLKEIVERYNPGYAKKNIQFITEYHFGGYAKHNQALVNFYEEFKLNFQIELDLVYTCKMVYGIFSLAKNNFFKKGSRILIIHSGGIQGNSSILKKFGKY